MTMDDSRIESIAQIKEFIKIAKDITFQGVSIKEKYLWIGDVLTRFRYHKLRKKEKTILKEYMMRMTGYSDAQLTRLIAKKRNVGKILTDNTAHHRFPKKYTADDIARIIETDRAHNRLAGPATKKIFEREYELFGNKAFSRLSGISVSHPH